MNAASRKIIAVAATGIWVNASEFFRNEILVKQYWIAHFQSLGIVYPEKLPNGILWMIWGFLYALAVFFMSRKFSFIQTALISWFMAFVLMWIVIFNLSVFPQAILIYAVPLSLLEAFVGTFICLKISPGDHSSGTHGALEAKAPP